MSFKNIKNINYKFCIWVALTLIVLASFLLFIFNSIKTATKSNQDIFAYTIKVRDTVEQLDKIFERAEVNVNVMVDDISNSYDTNKQKNKSYNLNFVAEMDGLIKSVLANSPSIDGSWFQLNADLPFSIHAYNWYEFRDNQFIDVKDKFNGTSSNNRKLTPEDDPCYFEAINKKQPSWSDIYTDSDTQKTVMTVSSPIYKNNALIGVVGIDISTNKLQQILKNMQSVLGESELYILDKKNNIILSQLNYNSKTIKNNTKYPFLTLFSGNKEGPIEYTDHLKKKTAIKLTLSNDYKLIISIDNNVLYFQTNNLIKIIYILFILLIILTTAIILNRPKETNNNLITEFIKEAENIEVENPLKTDK